MSEEKPKGLISKIRTAADTWLDSYVQNSRSQIEAQLSKSKAGMLEEEIYRRSLYLPPNGQFAGAGYKEKATRVTDQLLKSMSYRDSVIAAIIQTRLNQCAAHCRAQRDRHQKGFVLEFKDKNVEMTDERCEKVKVATEFISNCGKMEDRPRNQRMTLEEFMRRIIRDRLTYDRVGIEIIRDRKKDIHHFVPVDASTIKFASTTIRPNVYLAGSSVGLTGENRINTEPTEAEAEESTPDYVQLIDGQVKRVFTADELIFRFGNPVNDIYANGYSVGELELLVGIVTSHIHAESYNKQFFTNGHVAKGILHLEANVPQIKLEALKKQWYAQTTGTQNSWRTPIIAGADKVNWIPLTQSNRDMEFNSWLSYLIKLACAIYQISPSEIGFDISKGVGESTGSTLSEGGGESRLNHSKDKGLTPLLRFVEDIINENIIDKIDNELVFRFVGLNDEDSKEEVERLSKEVGKYKTVDEVRSEIGLEKLGETGGGHLILDTTYYQWLSQYGEFESKKNQEIQQQQSQQQDTGGDGMNVDGAEIGADDFNFDDEDDGDTDSAEVETDSEQETDEDFGKSKRRERSPKLLKIEYYRK